MTVRVRGACKSFGANRAVDGVGFDLEPGRIHALLGGNGSGKSTLIKMLAGVETADAGTVEIHGQTFPLAQMTPGRATAAGLRFVHQQRSTFPGLTVAENLAIGGRGFPVGGLGRIRWRAARCSAQDVLDRFEIQARPDQPLGELGPARQTMVAIARALHGHPDGYGILLLDEPTAALPEAEVRLLLAALRRQAQRGLAIVFVTHRLDEVFAAADRATLLRDGRVVDEVSPQEVGRADLVQLILGRPVEHVERLRCDDAGGVVLDGKGLTADGLGPLDLQVREGEVVGVAGLIGAGRSRLLKALFGVLPLQAGTLHVRGDRLRLRSPRDAMRAGFALVPEDRASDAAFAELTVLENVSVTVLGAYWRRGRLRARAERRDADALLATHLIKAQSVDDPLSSLSGGNQQKAVVARWLRREPRILLLDEPTQGVDVGARAEIYALIRDAVRSGCAVVVASSDSEELAAICDRVIVLARGRIVGEVSHEHLASDRLDRLAHAEAEAA